MARWTEHFKEVLKANVDGSEPVLESSLPAECFTDSLSVSEDQRGLLSPPSLEEVITSANKMASRKAAAEDGIHAELLRSRVVCEWLHRVILKA
jgi:hypothetical protein